VNAFPVVDVSRTAGWFSTAVPLVIDASLVNGSGDVDALLTTVTAQYRAIPREGFGYGVLRYLSGTLDMVPTPEVRFNHLGHHGPADPKALFRLASTTFVGGESPVLQGEEPLIGVKTFTADDQLIMQWDYRVRLHQRETIERLAERARTVLAGLVNHQPTA
jgi:non-ribosomal peptide synthase protein (TIGR01720 family)